MNGQSSRKRVRFAEGSKVGNNAENGSRSSYINDYEETDDNNSLGHSDEDNEALEADITTSRRQNRRINLDGYGSDASEQDEVGNLSDFSDEEEGQEVEKYVEIADDKISGEDDMFADEQDEPSFRNLKGQTDNKRKKFLSLDEIQGQEMESKSRMDSAGNGFGLKEGAVKGKQPENGNESSDNDNEGVDSGGEEGRKRKIKIEAFNMREDLEQGQFDTQGNFIWNKKDPMDYQDSWLDGVSKKAINQARDSKLKQDKTQTSQEHNLATRWDSVSNDDIIVAIINRLQSRETILSALARIGGSKKKTKNKWNKRTKAKKSGAMALDAEEEGKKEKQRKRVIDELTELADQAMARGMISIYDETYEYFVRTMRMANRISDEWESGTKLPTSAFPEDTSKQNTNSKCENEEGSVSDGGLLDDLDDIGESH
ncbi:hypothetical protein GGI25_004722 [Coemansia spiralis]|uniref:GYF domain-containing protein n=2 Tax=Coemansia TaxID=4863 RepID=A0A9W8G3K3_9FUNG|nr:hypothetical protein BX070DRAFT_26505 [Coemansia spiralis]KAJ1989694.1 hypothetical protein EDC05_004492 [Coemansia umbellata]KAJ2620503.1 hypothetical protein GGI26_004910 [Coemansia sp. RSA 1358]KAJ2673387.1 hypothetical protein GGI25_004722 [Coemansia spiralis]